MRTDGQMDMTKLIVAFRNFANAPNNNVTNHACTTHTIYAYLQRNHNCKQQVLHICACVYVCVCVDARARACACARVTLLIRSEDGASQPAKVGWTVRGLNPGGS